jgi:eukaryotic-like serine/threonine-protein kinase
MRGPVPFEPNHWDLIQELFLAAADLPAEQRAPYLDRHCPPDPAIRAHVDKLLRAESKAGQGVAEAIRSEARALFSSSDLAGMTLGVYRLVKLIGRGGMGDVYLAERADDLYGKQVAIKVIRHGLDSEEPVRRFRLECQILATLEHPYIARLMDGGTTADGRPYFAMEYVKGDPIHQYCDSHELDISARCKLFMRVCEAVSNAHSNLIIHRDLKPGNVLVTAEGTPKLLDFGVAKLLGGRLAMDLTVRAGDLPFTPEYASPEQVKGLSLTTASDVYSLGTILYELLSGQRAQSMETMSPGEISRAVCDVEPPRPSAAAIGKSSAWRKRLTGDLDDIVMMAIRKEPERRYQSVEQLAAEIRRHLDGEPVLARSDSRFYRAGRFVRKHAWAMTAVAAIVLTLLSGIIAATNQARKAEAQRRIAEAERQTAQAERQAAKTERDAAVRERNRAEFEHGVAVQAETRAVQESAVAKQEEARAESRLSQMLELANGALLDIQTKIEPLVGATPARKDLLNTTLQFLEHLAKDAPQDKRLRMVMSEAYLQAGDVQGRPLHPNLGDTAGALKSYRKAVELIQPLWKSTANDPEVAASWLDCQLRIGEAQEALQRSAEAVAIFTGARTIAAKWADRDPQMARRYADFSGELSQIVMYQDPAQGLEYIHSEIDTLTKLPGADRDPEILSRLVSAQCRTGTLFNRSGRSREAVDELLKCAATQETLVQRDPNNAVWQRRLLIAYGNAASALGNPFTSNLGEPERALVYFNKALKIAEAMASADPKDQTAKSDVAAALLRIGSIKPDAAGRAEALAKLRHAIVILNELSKSDPKKTSLYSNLALAHEYAGRRLIEMSNLDQAMIDLRTSLSIAEQLLRAEPDDTVAHSQAIAAEQGIAQALSAKGDFRQAVEVSEQSIARAKAFVHPSVNILRRQLHVIETHRDLSFVYLAAGDCPNARKYAEIALSLYWDKAPPAQIATLYKEETRSLEVIFRQCGVNAGAVQH